MPAVETSVPPANELLDKMVAARQLSASDVRSLTRLGNATVRSEADVLQWLAKEYGLQFTTLEDIEPDKEVLSLFPARLLLKGELLPLRRNNGSVEIATSKLFATQELDALRSLSGLKLRPVLAP